MYNIAPGPGILWGGQDRAVAERGKGKGGSHGWNASGLFLMARVGAWRWGKIVPTIATPLGGFDDAEGSRGAREAIPTVEAHPGDFLMARNEPKRWGKPRGRMFPRLLHPRGHPIKLGYR